LVQKCGFILFDMRCYCWILWVLFY